MNGSLLNVFKAIRLAFIFILPFNSNIVINACWNPEASKAFHDTVTQWLNTEYTWGGGHSYDYYNTYGIDSVLSYGIDCSGLISVGMWEHFGSSWNDEWGNTVSTMCSDPYFTEYDNNQNSIWVGDIVITSSGGHVGVVDENNGDGTTDFIHAAGNSEDDPPDRVIISYNVDPWTDSTWGSNHGAKYKGLTPP